MNKPETTPRSPCAMNSRLKILVLRVLGGLLVLYAFGWLYLIYIYLFIFVRNTLPTLPDTTRANVAQFMHLPQVHFMQTIVYASPLPLLLFGVGCLCACEWARRSAIALLALLCLALFGVTHMAVTGIHLGSIQFQITPRHGYFFAAALLFIHGFVIEFLLRSRAQT